MTELPAAPHCDSRILHRKGDCEFCDQRPEWQALRELWGIAFTGYEPRGDMPECGQRFRYSPSGELYTCRRAAGHPRDDRTAAPNGHGSDPEWERLPCPADAARPPGSSADHRRWGGNTATSKRGDPSQPRQTAASVMMYGDQGARAPWPFPERWMRNIARPFIEWGMKRRGWRKEGEWWFFRSR